MAKVYVPHVAVTLSGFLGVDEVENASGRRRSTPVGGCGKGPERDRTPGACDACNSLTDHGDVVFGSLDSRGGSVLAAHQVGARRSERDRCAADR